MKIETKNWALNDDRLPPNEALMRTPPDEAFLESIKEVQLEAIGVGYVEAEDKWMLMFGRKRLLALRQLFERGAVKNTIRVTTFSPVTRNDVAYYALQENSFRSPNPISDALAIIELLELKVPVSDIAKETGLGTTEVKKLYNEYGKFPKWMLKGFLEGKIAISTGQKFIRLGKDTQKALEKVFKKEKKLTGSMVVEARQAIQAEQYINIVPAGAFETDNFQQSTFTRAELTPLLALSPEECKKTLSKLLS